MKQKTIPAYLFVISFFLLAGFASMVAIAKNDNAGGNNNKNEKLEKSDKITENSAQLNKVGNEVANVKVYQKADEAKGETNAKIHKEKTTEVIANLEQIQTQTENLGTEDSLKIEVKNKAKKQISEVVSEQKISQETIANAISGVEEEGSTKKFFFGPDYKNLGQLRSELVQNRNQIRKLTQSIGALTQSGEDVTMLQAQLATLTQERERIKNIVVDNQETFSLLGWFSRYINNYEETPINEAEENDLIEEVEEAVAIVPVVEETVIPATATSTESSENETVVAP
ncbi:MAG: hypothetical protein WC682_01745 [Parcubacteria group bacterium]|jgi:DNA repair exonuclease SbcCD ATPase subunit